MKTIFISSDSLGSHDLTRDEDFLILLNEYNDVRQFYALACL